MNRDTFLSYKRYVWFWLTLAALLIMSVFYVLDHPVGGRNGGTVLGYTYGGIATAGILYLMWYGIRKRAYYSRVTTLKGMLAAHVWIGIGLIFVVPLHSGFHFGFNVHTLAYALMLLTIFSGLWGVVMYQKYPTQMLSQRGGGTLKQLLEQIRSISQEISKMAEASGKPAKPKSDAFLSLLRQVDFVFQPSFFRSIFSRDPAQIERSALAKLLGGLPQDEQQDGLTLIGLANKKRELVERLQNETRVLTWVRVWLFFHLPISIGLVVALAIHIFSVFYYW